MEALNNRAAFLEQQVTRRAAASFISPQGKHGTSSKRSRMSNRTPTLPEYRLEGSPEEHIAVVTNNQKRCTYCAFLYAKAKLDAAHPLPKVERPTRKCLRCGDHLCYMHFAMFHSEDWIVLLLCCIVVDPALELFDVLSTEGWVPYIAEPDIWMRKNTNEYEYIGVYVDENISEMKMGCWSYPQGNIFNEWWITSSVCSTRSQNSLHHHSNTEINTSEELDIDGISKYQSLMGSTNSVDIATATWNVRFSGEPKDTLPVGISEKWINVASRLIAVMISQILYCSKNTVGHAQSTRVRR
jgi:hypothetical protein